MKYLLPSQPVVTEAFRQYLFSNTTLLYQKVARQMNSSLNFYLIGVLMGARELN